MDNSPAIRCRGLVQDYGTVRPSTDWIWKFARVCALGRSVRMALRMFRWQRAEKHWRDLLWSQSQFAKVVFVEFAVRVSRFV